MNMMVSKWDIDSEYLQMKLGVSSPLPRKLVAKRLSIVFSVANGRKLQTHQNIIVVNISHNVFPFKSYIYIVYTYIVYIYIDSLSRQFFDGSARSDLSIQISRHQYCIDFHKKKHSKKRASSGIHPHTPGKLRPHPSTLSSQGIYISG